MRATITWIGAALAATSCGGREAVAPASRPAPPARSVRTATVSLEPGGAAQVPASVAARKRATLASRIAASVVELPYREGEWVPAGEVAVRLDDGALRAGLEAAQASASAAAADLKRVEALLAKDAATAQERDGAVAQAARARAALTAAREELAYAVLRAPFAGRVAQRPVNVGDVVNPGQPLLALEGAGSFELVATVDSEQVARLRAGSELLARVDGQEQPLTATVRAVGASGDAVTHRFEVRADLPRAEGLRSGLFARLEVPEPGAEPRLTVPAQALFRRGGLTGAFVVQDGRARLRWVAAGASADGVTEVRAGLEPGERVVLEPRGLEDGDPVEAAS